jgi:hypothetical protein
MVFQIPHHIKVFPPAIQDFEAGLLLITTDFAIMKRYGAAQSRATPYQFICGIFHTGSILHCKINFELITKYARGGQAGKLKSLEA